VVRSVIADVEAVRLEAMLSKSEPNVVVEAKYVVYSVGLIPMIEHGEPDVHVVEFNAVMMVPVIKFWRSMPEDFPEVYSRVH